MIIGINGRIGSGKDTVGKIIQYLTTVKDNYGNHYTKEEYFGKSELASLWLNYHSEWEIKKFAGKLKQIASLMTGIPVEKFEDQEFKKKTFQQLVDEGYISQSQLDILKNI